jgi:hypothetical protein
MADEKLTGEMVMDRHPEIFRERNLPMQQTCMCWGLEVGDGWLPHIDMVCNLLDEYAKRTGVQVVAEQVKQKFGELRFYHHLNIPGPGDMEEEQAVFLAKRCEEIIATMATLCSFTCENCGAPGSTKGSRGWIMCLCPDCREARGK